MPDKTHTTIEKFKKTPWNGGPPNLQTVLKGLYESEINFSISCFWDGGIEVGLGDQTNGIVAGMNFDSKNADEIARWLHCEAISHFPNSNYAMDNSYE